MIDGDGSEWQGGLLSFKESPVALGLSNDAEHLYLGLVTPDRMTAHRLTRLGFTFWLAPGGGRGDRQLGIRFLPSRPMAPPDPAVRKDPGARDRAWLEQPLEAPTRAVLLDGKGKHLAMGTLSELPGVKLAARVDDQGLLAIEVRIPMGETPQGTGSIVLPPGSVLGVGLKAEVPKRPTDARREEMGGDRGGRGGGRGGMGGMGGKGGGRMGQGGGHGGRQGPQPLDLWLRTRLPVAPGV